MAAKTSSEKSLPAKKSAVKAGPKNSGLLIGYARVSTQDQNLQLQTEALRKAGCKIFFEDRASGIWAERLGLAKARESLRAGDNYHARAERKPCAWNAWTRTSKSFGGKRAGSGSVGGVWCAAPKRPPLRVTMAFGVGLPMAH